MGGFILKTTLDSQVGFSGRCLALPNDRNWSKQLAWVTILQSSSYELWYFQQRGNSPAFGPEQALVNRINAALAS
jgi:hypothetical protein